MAQRTNGLVEVMNQGSDAVLDMIETGNERAFRVSNIILQELRRTQRDNADLTGQWLSAPTDIIGITKAAVETVTRQQRRRFEIGRTFMDDLTGIREETQDTFRRVMNANRDAVEMGVNAGRNAVGRAAEEIGDQVEKIGDRVEKIGDRAEDLGNATARALKSNRRNG